MGDTAEPVPAEDMMLMMDCYSNENGSKDTQQAEQPQSKQPAEDMMLMMDCYSAELGYKLPEELPKNDKSTYLVFDFLQVNEEDYVPLGLMWTKYDDPRKNASQSPNTNHEPLDSPVVDADAKTSESSEKVDGPVVNGDSSDKDIQFGKGCFVLWDLEISEKEPMIQSPSVNGAKRKGLEEILNSPSVKRLRTSPADKNITESKNMSKVQLARAINAGLLEPKEGSLVSADDTTSLFRMMTETQENGGSQPWFEQARMDVKLEPEWSDSAWSDDIIRLNNKPDVPATPIGRSSGKSRKSYTPMKVTSVPPDPVTPPSSSPASLNGSLMGSAMSGVSSLHRNLMPNCEVCHQKMFSDRDVQRHNDAHCGRLALAHQCSGCLKLFKSSKWFHNHVMKSHGQLGFHKCMFCLATFDDIRLFLAHVGSHDRETERYLLEADPARVDEAPPPSTPSTVKKSTPSRKLEEKPKEQIISDARQFAETMLDDTLKDDILQRVADVEVMIGELAGMVQAGTGGSPQALFLEGRMQLKLMELVQLTNQKVPGPRSSVLFSGKSSFKSEASSSQTCHMVLSPLDDKIGFVNASVSDDGSVSADSLKAIYNQELQRSQERSASQEREDYEKQPHKCHKCEKGFSDEESLEKHMMLHANLKLWECDFCEEKFTNLYEFGNHRLIHKGSANVKSNMMKARKERDQTLSEEKKWICGECGAAFKRSQHLKRHSLTHSGEKPYKCEICKEQFKRKDKLKQHTLKHFSEKQPFMCGLCGDMFQNKEDVKRHALIHSEPMEEEPPAEDVPFRCTTCELGFYDEHEFKSHRLVHALERLYTCPTCGQKLTNADEYRKHTLKHEEKKAGEPSEIVEEEIVSEEDGEDRNSTMCKECGATFTRPQHLKRHMLTHSGLRPFECDVCFATFQRKDKLREHYMMHTGEKPYECSICLVKFRQKYELKKHVSMFHAEMDAIDGGDLDGKLVVKMNFLSKPSIE